MIMIIIPSNLAINLESSCYRKSEAEVTGARSAPQSSWELHDQSRGGTR